MGCKNIVLGDPNLTYYMDEKNVTVDSLSRGTGISAKTIQRYRSGERVPGLENAYAIASYLNVNLDKLWCKFDVK